MIDRRPALIVRPTGAADVISAVRFAREQDLPIAVRSGGHSVPGFSTCDDGIVIDLSQMRGARVDPSRRTAQVNGGAHLGDLDREAQAFGLACPVGVVSHTGAAGLTLGGGMGRLQRKFGLTIDSLLSVDVVTADGRLVRASEDENAELFWGLRGAGANFGIATSLEYRLHPVDRVITHGAIRRAARPRPRTGGALPRPGRERARRAVDRLRALARRRPPCRSPTSPRCTVGRCRTPTATLRRYAHSRPPPAPSTRSRTSGRRR